MIEEGYELEIPKGDREYVLLDTQTNREKIFSLVRDFNAIIYDFEDLKTLMEDMKDVEDTDE